MSEIILIIIIVILFLSIIDIYDIIKSINSRLDSIEKTIFEFQNKFDLESQKNTARKSKNK